MGCFPLGNFHRAIDRMREGSFTISSTYFSSSILILIKWIIYVKQKSFVRASPPSRAVSRRHIVPNRVARINREREAVLCICQRCLCLINIFFGEHKYENNTLQKKIWYFITSGFNGIHFNIIYHIGSSVLRHCCAYEKMETVTGDDKSREISL